MGSRALPLLLLGSLLATGCASPPPPADVIFTGGRVHTLDSERPEARAVAARGGAIVYVGDEKGARAYRGGSTRVIDLDGATVLPGFTDSHMHLAGVGREAMELSLKGAESLGELLRRVSERVRGTPPGEWVVGRGWIETFWSPPVFPTRNDLDAISPDHPVFLVRVDGHGGVANSRALEIAGIDPGTEDPSGGQILRDDGGRPTGMLLDNAMGLVLRHAPDLGESRRREALIAGAHLYAERGWTGVQVAGSSRREAAMLRDLVEAQEIPIRIYDAIYGPGEDAEWLLENGPILLSRQGDPAPRFTLRTVKVSYDGALGSGMAALLEPYRDREGAGHLKHPDGTLLPLFAAALRRGIQVEVHAIGDRANRRILDLYEASFAAVPPESRMLAEPRWRVEHAQHLGDAEIPRFARLGVIPSMQPSHAIGDLHFAPARLGLERLAGAYAWRRLIDAGSIIPAGTDAPVEAGEPLVELYAAVARRDLKGRSGPGWHPELAVSREEALKMLTLWPAHAAFEEQLRGSIEVGKACDLTILNRDIMEIPIEEIPAVRCVMTVVGGDIVHPRAER